MFRVLASIARIHIVAIGSMGTLTFAYALCGIHAWGLALLCACDWFVVNLLNRVVDLKEDAANAIPGTELVARHKRSTLAVGFGVLVASLAPTWLWAPALVGWRLAFHALGFAYNWPLLGGRRIKELAFWKNTASATGFLITLFAYPLSTAPRADDVTVGIVVAAAAFFFLFELSYEVLYDLRDVEGDRLAGVRTWPVLWGVRRGYQIARGLMLGSFIVVIVGYLIGVLPWRVAIMGAAPVMQMAASVRIERRGITTRDCVQITWAGTVLLVAWHLWEALGLPGA